MLLFSLLPFNLYQLSDGSAQLVSPKAVGPEASARAKTCARRWRLFSGVWGQAPDEMLCRLDTSIQYH